MMITRVLTKPLLVSFSIFLALRQEISSVIITASPMFHTHACKVFKLFKATLTVTIKSARDLATYQLVCFFLK